MNTFTSIDRNKPSQTDTKDPKHKKYAQTTDRNLINLGEDTRTPTINTPRQQHERQPTHTIGSPHPNRKIYSVGILESRSTKIILLSICMRTRVRTWRKREKRPGNHRNENENKRPIISKEQTAPDATHRTNPRWRRKKVEKNANPGGGILHR